MYSFMVKGHTVIICLVPVRSGRWITESGGTCYNVSH
jgi:hypothetical protein